MARSRKVKAGKFVEKLLARRDAAYPDRPCECWDCLREAGLTPPLKSRSQYRSQFPKPWHEVKGPGVDVPGVLDHAALVQGTKEETKIEEALDRLEAVRV